MSLKQMIIAAAKRLRDAYVSVGYPLLPFTRLIRGPLRWYYHRFSLLRHDLRPYWKPRLLSLLHELLVREHPQDFRIYRNQIKFRSHGSLMSVQAYYTGEVEPHLVRYVAGQVRPGFVMLDVGAHHGAFTLVVAHELKSRGWEGLIHSFEPAPVNFAVLEHNVRQNGLTRYVVLHQEAVSDAPTRQRLVLEERDNSGNFLEPAGSNSSLVSSEGRTVREVAATTLDALLNSLPAVHLIKLDVQGAEPRVLAGGRKLIERFRPVIVVEAVPGWPSTEQTREFLVRYKYQIHGVNAASRLCSPNSKEAFVSWDWVGIPL